jgi:Tat protein secretion system quality control protein TatD with DNase activity
LLITFQIPFDHSLDSILGGFPLRHLSLPLSLKEVVVQQTLLVPPMLGALLNLQSLLKVPFPSLPPTLLFLLSLISSDWQRELKEYLWRYPQAGIGECGLDKMITKHIPMSFQKEILSQHLQIALEFNRPVTLHCVQSWGNLLATLQETIRSHLVSGSSSSLPSNVNFILHSCNKLPPDLVHSFLELQQEQQGQGQRQQGQKQQGQQGQGQGCGHGGVYFSFNGKQSSFTSSEIKMARQIPHDRLLLESDSPDQRPNWSLADLLRSMEATGDKEEEEEGKGRGRGATGARAEGGGEDEEPLPVDLELKQGKERTEKEGIEGRKGTGQRQQQKQQPENEPSAVLYACHALARALEVSPEYLAEVTSANAQRVFWFDFKS